MVKGKKQTGRGTDFASSDEKDVFICTKCRYRFSTSGVLNFSNSPEHKNIKGDNCDCNNIIHQY